MPVLQSDRPSSGGPSIRLSWRRRRWSSDAKYKETLSRIYAGGKTTLMFLVGGMYIHENFLKKMIYLKSESVCLSVCVQRWCDRPHLTRRYRDIDVSLTDVLTISRTASSHLARPRGRYTGRTQCRLNIANKRTMPLGAEEDTAHDTP